MTAVLQQIASSGLLLLFGILALQVWRRSGSMRRDRAALTWAVTAANFLVIGVYSTAHSLVSAAAYPGGDKSWLWGFLARWALPANDGRCIASILFGIMLVVVMTVPRRSAPRIAAMAPLAIAATAVVGTLGARLFPQTAIYDYLTIMAVLNAATAVVLMLALLVAAHNDGMDQLLWLSLSAYALKETVSVSLLAVMAWWSFASVKTYFVVYFWLQVAATSCMVVLAARRLHLASGGRRVPAVFERLHDLRRPAHG